MVAATDNNRLAGVDNQRPLLVAGVLASRSPASAQRLGAAPSAAPTTATPRFKSTAAATATDVEEGEEEAVPSTSPGSATKALTSSPPPKALATSSTSCTSPPTYW
jgi:hypothetical protein